MSGLLGLQLHAGPPMKVQFKNIRLKRISDQSQTSGNASKTIVFVAGGPSHDYGSHEHNAGCLLLARLLRQHMPGYEVTVHRSGWPQNPARPLRALMASCCSVTGGAATWPCPTWTSWAG